MRVLDLDLDFFLADCCPLAAPGSRPDVDGCEPWSKADVAAFLEEQCGLSAQRPVPGRIFDTHDQALVFWHEQMEKGSLTAPFHVTHVDAHSDLGIGYPGPGFVLYNVLPRPMPQRVDIAGYYRQKKLDEANYLLFALAFRDISGLDNVRNPRSRADIPPQLLSESDAECIRLRSLTSRLFEDQNGVEPMIPFHVYDDYRTFRACAPYDFMTLAISPRYAPREADALLEVIARYLKPI
ncbi:MAG: UPF0489 family protein [bacterium]|nr:UPF0489 family protein [bacterium]